MRVFVNGRFRCQRVTGVQRYAQEITARFADRLEVIEPRSAGRGIRGHVWEQFALGRKTAGGLLWSPSGTGPLSVERQVVTIHDCAFVDCRRSFSHTFAAWYSWLVPRLARKVRHVLTVSEFSRRRIIEVCRVPEEKVTVVPNGVSTAFREIDAASLDSVRDRLGLPPIYVLCVGSLDPRKNLPRLLEAWNCSCLGGADRKLVLAGAPSHVFRKVGLKSDPAHVQSLGYVSDEDLPALYAGAEAFVYPSLYEGFGLTVLEAMASGTPVVCSSTTALPETAGDAAVLVDPHNTVDIAAGLVRAVKDSGLRAELREKGLARVAGFTWDRAAEATWRVLEAAAA